jgi:hypothetical protein
MREARQTRALVGRPHVIPEVYGHERKAMVFEQYDLKAILQLILLIIERRLRLRVGCGLIRCAICARAGKRSEAIWDEKREQSNQ